MPCPEFDRMERGNSELTRPLAVSAWTSAPGWAAQIDADVPPDAVRFHILLQHVRGNVAIHRAADETQALRQAHHEIDAQIVQQDVAAAAVIPANMRRGIGCRGGAEASAVTGAAIERASRVGIRVDGANGQSTFMLHDLDGHPGGIAEPPLGRDDLDFITAGRLGADVAVDVVDFDNLTGRNPAMPTGFLLNRGLGLQVRTVDRTGGGRQGSNREYSRQLHKSG